MAWVWWLKEEETRDQVVKGLNPNPGAWSYKENFPRKITLMLFLSILIGWKILSIQREEMKQKQIPRQTRFMSMNPHLQRFMILLRLTSYVWAKFLFSAIHWKIEFWK